MTTVTIGANTTNTYSGAADCEINKFEPTSTHNGGAFNVQNDASFPNNCLVSFSGVSNIASGNTVSAATLFVWLDGESTSFVTGTIELRRVLRNWSESQATWNVYTTGNSWTTAGCLSNANDRIGTASTSITGLDSGTGQYYGITGLAADVQAFVDGTASNYGWVLECTTSGVWKNFISNSGADGNRPYLQVVYAPAGVALTGSASTGGTGTQVPSSAKAAAGSALTPGTGTQVPNISVGL